MLAKKKFFFLILEIGLCISFMRKRRVSNTSENISTSKYEFLQVGFMELF